MSRFSSPWTQGLVFSARKIYGRTNSHDHIFVHEPFQSDVFGSYDVTSGSCRAGVVVHGDRGVLLPIRHGRGGPEQVRVHAVVFVRVVNPMTPRILQGRGYTGSERWERKVMLPLVTAFHIGYFLMFLAYFWDAWLTRSYWRGGSSQTWAARTLKIWGRSNVDRVGEYELVKRSVLDWQQWLAQSRRTCKEKV